VRRISDEPIVAADAIPGWSESGEPSTPQMIESCTLSPLSWLTNKSVASADEIGQRGRTLSTPFHATTEKMGP
jgi:hypothetical protein